MTKNEEIIYANVCGIIDNYAKRMKTMAKEAFEHKAIETEGHNPMYLGLANDVACAAMRWAILDMKLFLNDKGNAIQISEAMERIFRTEEEIKAANERLLKNIKF